MFLRLLFLLLLLLLLLRLLLPLRCWASNLLLSLWRRVSCVLFPRCLRAWLLLLAALR